MANFRTSILSTAVAMLAPHWALFRMSDDLPSAQAAPVETQNAPAPDAQAATDAANVAAGEQAASDEVPATVTIEVPAQHQALLERAAAVLHQAEGWVIDNVEAGIKQLENMLGINTNTSL